MPEKMSDETSGTSAVRRRGFLASMAIGTAGAVAMGPGRAAAEAIGTTAETPTALSGSSTTFGRIFRGLPSFAPANDQVRAALTDVGRLGGPIDAKDPLEVGPIRLITEPALSPNNLDNPTHTAGTTFFGQFLDHDLTFDTTSTLGRPTSPEATTNNRTPALDLDSVYGRGPRVDRQLYNPADPAKFVVGSGGVFEDVPRGPNNVAIIADPRNDENMMISGLQAAMLLFHNRVVDLLRSLHTPESQVFELARTAVTWHYQWIIVHEFLPQIIGAAETEDILRNGRRFYRPSQAFIPVEFQGAAYRFGHSMVRPSYRANLKGNADGSPFFGFVFDPAGETQADPVDLRGGRRAPRRFIGWQTFFDFADGNVRPNKRIDTNISSPLFQLPLGTIADGTPPISLATRNLLRQLTWEIPSGQRLAQEMRLPALQASDFPELAGYGLGLDSSTPLWYYVLKEAEVMSDGLKLGPVGGRIVGEVFIGLLQLDSHSYLRALPAFRPVLPSRVPGQFGMVDLLRFARVDPVSRGQ
jgi:hypothetical protein